ncbi:EAL domain-containing protein [Thiomicrospira sp. R3]|uniref:EAL domain-containing protein n=1 Tax=Thiomicrospira sp. R3 TaxID=3035472 RepID=UPI00259B1AB2|nr:EAL domain-containing protein [Thiomicrospira sp. R3]WFE69224.1 EAL domain-containing protein [Thiomicrospira sp. R3]
MNINKSLFLVIALWLFSFVFGSPALKAEPGTEQASAQPTFYTVGILAFRDKALTTQRWQPLIDYLNQQLPGYRFEAAIYYMDELERAVKLRQVDFILTQPAHYVLITYRNSLTSPLASMLNFEGEFITDRFGGVIFTASHRDDIATLRDVKGKTIAAGSRSSLGGYQMQAFELLQHGIRLPKGATLIETGQRQDNAVIAVLSGEADVGFVRTGVLENLVANNLLDMRQIKLLNAQRFADFPFVTSTALYPEWPFAALYHVDKDVARQVAASILAIPLAGELAHSMQIGGFTIPGDYRSIDLLMRELRLEPFDSLQLTPTDLIDQWLTELIAIFLIVVLLISVIMLRLIQRQRQLKQEQQRLVDALDQVRLLSQAVEQSPDSVAITDKQGRLIYMNPSFERVTGYQIAELKGHNPRLLQSGQTAKAVYQDMWQTLSAGKVWRGELSNRRKNGEIYPSRAIMSPVANEQHEVTHFLAIQHDITAIKEREQRIAELLYQDSVTQMANRNKLLEIMDQVLHQPQIVPVAGCLVLLNIARFKFINQQHGINVGDEVLRLVAKRLERSFADSGVVARLAADQFAVFCENKARFNEVDEWLKMMGQRVLISLQPPMEVKGETYDFEVGVGVAPLLFNAQHQTSGDAINQVFNQAGMAIQEARQQPGQGLRIFNEQLLAQSIERHQLQQSLAQAIRESQLRLFVQPQFKQNDSLVGLECLVRWQHPDKGLLAPNFFIAMAEESNLIIDLGNWVMEHACQLLAQLQQHNASIRVAVNISPRHFRQNDFVASCQAHLAAAGALAHGLMLEITESLFLDDLDEIVTKMHQLKAMGVMFSIDDFGTGYSSLSYLQHLPVDELKIDRSFILGLEKYGVERSLVPAIYAMAQQMHLLVVAEGIETPEQRQLLAQFSQLELQGFLLGKPQDVQAWWQDFMATDQFAQA